MPDENDKSAGWTQFKDGEPVADGAKRGIANTRMIVAGLALIAAVIFIVQNDNRVSTDFLFFSGTARLWVVILGSVLLGALLGQVAGVVARRRKQD